MNDVIDSWRALIIIACYQSDNRQLESTHSFVIYYSSSIHHIIAAVPTKIGSSAFQKILNLIPIIISLNPTQLQPLIQFSFDHNQLKFNSSRIRETYLDICRS